MKTKIMQELESVLKQFDSKYYLGKELNKEKVINDLQSQNPELVRSFMTNDIVKKHFTSTIEDYTIIEINKLIETFEMDDYWMDSHTKYSKKIGLTANGKFIDESTDVVLDFPYKDTVLKAGMTKEDVTSDDLKPDEPFYNEIIAAEEIDVMLDKKILINAKRYSIEGAEEAINFSEEDNLILKGNNLLSLYTLKDKYAGKVKMIYIDPPYYFNNTKSSDAFLYNSNFKLSTWLTFMKNRLEIAKSLLSENGVIFVSMKDDGQAYLKILMDNIFGKENFVETFIWRNTDNSDSLANKSRSGLEYIHAYEIPKDSNIKWKGAFSQNDDAPLFNAGNPLGTRIFPAGSIKFNIPDGIYNSGKYTNSELHNDLVVKDGFNQNDIEISGKFKWSQSLINEEIENRTYFIVKSKKFSLRYQRKDASVMAPEKMITNDYLSKSIGVGTNEDSDRHLRKLNLSFSYSKPESLIAFLIRATTNEGDLILDFFMGSATTQAVAMKMNRHFIGIEQMDYIETVSVPRLQKVIGGEQGGISKDVNWQGGGSFVYAELMEKSSGYIDAVQKANNQAELFEIYQVMLDNVSLNFRVDLEEVAEILNSNASLKDKQKILLKVIDKNQLYYNLSEIDDRNVRDLISDSDYAFNQSFYKEGDDFGEKEN